MAEKSYQYNIEQDVTVGDLLQDKTSIFYNIELSSFFEMKYDGISNRNIIEQSYSEDFAKISEEQGLNGTLNMLILAGTTLAVNKGQANLEVVALGGKNLFASQGDFNTFISEKYRELINDVDYVQDYYIKTRGKVSAIYKNYNVSVWIWSRSLGRIIDVSPYINTVGTSVSMGSGGNFSINLEGVLPDKQNPDQPITTNIKTKSDTISYARYVEDETQTTPAPYFHRWIQKNDCVFIRFESLKLETDRNEDRGTFVSKNDLPNKVYDMIGLVDSSKYSFNGSNDNSSVIVTGRDMMKLLTDDGSWFYPLQFIKGADTLFYNTDQDNKWFKRNFVDGDFKNLFVYSLRSIKDTVGFIINQLSNLGAVEDELFSAYGDTRTEVVRINNQDLIEWNELQGVWQIIDVLIDDSVKDRRIANSQIARPDGNIKEQLDKVCQRPFVEFYGDTYGDKYEFIVRQPPFTRSQVQKYIKENEIIEIDLKEVDNYSLDWESTSYSWYQINPQSVFLGNNESIALAYIPIVFFPRVTEIFGNNRLVVTDNYFSQQAFEGKEGTENRDKFKEAIINDFIYIIESNCYLPFTRRGSISMDRERRIKVGTWIRFKPTGELCYVDSVQNNYSCNRDSVDGSTTIQVSRCMKESYVTGQIRPESGEDIDTFTYWDVVDLETIRKTLIQKLTNPSGEQQQQKVDNTVKANFGLNDYIFDFFLNRQQFD